MSKFTRAACLWNVGRNRSTRRKPTESRGEHANSTWTLVVFSMIDSNCIRAVVLRVNTPASLPFSQYAAAPLVVTHLEMWCPHLQMLKKPSPELHPITFLLHERQEKVFLIQAKTRWTRFFFLFFFFSLVSISSLSLTFTVDSDIGSSPACKLNTQPHSVNFTQR